MHQRSAQFGFDDSHIFETADRVLAAVAEVLSQPEQKQCLEVLKQELVTRRTPAHAMIEAFEKSNTIEESLLRSAAADA